MQFGNYSSAWYWMALDTQKQVFYATSKAQPDLTAEGITVDDAVKNLITLVQQNSAKSNLATKTTA
ncbi:hypothetical protein IV38_GL001634 [Lactobacillus selangorensis]|uniref:Uncharacterized protein n=1 Tax=Lactobacillus selangorensis TaxID=81857 RepID=A0A0R2FS76_9LACO|nr:hypothetical protein [Lactobacillus selangorensis]KRN28182.1 hypothetical protein IV38_GL001634 [Lactobacillus selangorensis]KRN30942.1 hypothetical protein IV40_GL001581 [Lactobacillus selangorensis]